MAPATPPAVTPDTTAATVPAVTPDATAAATPAGTPATRPRLSADDWVAAGLHLLTEEGLAGIKIDALAERLGVTKGSFYWHFKSLTAFLEVMAAQFIARQNAQIATLTATAPADPRERLLAMMHRISDPHAASLERAIRGWAYEHAELARHVEAVDHWAHGVVVAAFERLGFAGHEAEVRAKTLYYAGVGRLHTGVLGEPEGPEHREQLLDLLTQR